uniref:Uncharacterized protein n=1 Tax=Cucumis melo TaxID=3656 RepID=A0A9I9E5M9_CUCME
MISSPLFSGSSFLFHLRSPTKGTLFRINTMDTAHSVVSTNDVILNRSCRDMGVEASYICIGEGSSTSLAQPPILGVPLLAHMDSTKNKYVEVIGIVRIKIRERN